MKLKYSLTVVFLAFYALAHAQTCTQTALSKKFDFKITRVITATKDGAEDHMYSKIIVLIFNKNKKTAIQRIVIDADYLAEAVYQDCNNVRSYTTGKNKDIEVVDSDFGDLIIADLNFDGKEDLAIKRESGGAVGPFYEFYIQNEKNTFTKDTYLTEKMSSFPSDIDWKEKTLTTNIFATYYSSHQTVYKYNTVTKKWMLIKSQYIKI